MASKHRDRALRTALVVLLVVLVVRAWNQAADDNDFGVFHLAGRAVAHGESPYEIEHPERRQYLYPPTLSILIAPLGLLPHDVAAGFWAVGMMTAIAVSFALLLRFVRPSGERERRWIGVAALLIAGRAIDSELGNGQSNHLVLLGLVLGVVALASHRPWRAGAAFAFATALKVAPGLFGLWLLVTGRWRALGGFVATLVVLLGVLPLAVWGPTRTAHGYEHLRARLGGQYETESDAGDEDARVPGYSLRAFVFHLTTDIQAASHTGGRDIRINVIDGSTELATGIYWGVAAIVIALSFLALRRREATRAWVLLEASIVAVTMLLIAPITRSAHFVTLLLPAFVAASVWVRSKTRPTLAWVLVPTLLTFGTSRGVLGKVASSWARALGTLTFAMLALWIGALIFARTRAVNRIDRTESTAESSA